MIKAWNEFKAGWRESRWIKYFSIYLIIIVSVVVLIDNGIKGQFSTPPSLLQISLTTLGALVSYLVAQSRVNRTPHKILGIPGESILALVNFLYSPAKVEQTFAPMVADWRHEYFEAMRQGREAKARWISLRYRWAFIKVICLSPIFLLVKQLGSVSKKS